MAKTTFSGPVHSLNGFVGVPTVPVYTVADAPSASAAGEGAMIAVSDGTAGAFGLAVSDGTDWLDPTGSVISAS